MNVSRRNFLKTVTASGIATALIGLTGCTESDTGSNTTATSELSSEPQSAEHKISETKTADIVVCGGGMSGLAAAVAASADGTSVIVLEANNMTGGNGQGTEGIFACGSSLQKAAGIDFTFSEVITDELEFFNYRIDTLAWKDMVNSSADNLDWLLNNGVLIDGVDNYRGMGKFEGFHWWGGGVDDGYVTTGGALNGYITPMTNKAIEQGVEILYETRGLELLMDAGAISGILAQTVDGDWIQIDCKAVILATGGYADNDDKLLEMGIDPTTVSRMGMPHHEGDGLDMALSVGGVDTRSQHCVMREPGCIGYPFGTTLGAMGLHSGGPYVFVNDKGERFTDENCITKNQAYIANVVLSQPKCFAIVNDAVLNQLNDTVSPGIVDDAKNALDQGAAVFTADTLEDLASEIGAEKDTLEESFNRYNMFCAQQIDEDFAKDPSMLLAMENGPFWAFQMGLFYFATLGGIATNRNFEVIDSEKQAIPGLWAVGADGCELYRETYTVMVPASCMGNNINSGRHAGIEAAAYCK